MPAPRCTVVAQVLILSRYVKQTNRYKNPGIVDVDLHMALFDNIVPLLIQWRTKGYMPKLIDAATAALSSPQEGAAREAGREGPRPYRRFERREGGREGGREEGRGRPERAPRGGSEVDEVQFRGKEGVLTRWVSREHWGLITYDGVSTAYLNEMHVDPAHKPALALNAKVKFDGVVTAKSKEKGKVEARNVFVVPHALAPK